MCPNADGGSASPVLYIQVRDFQGLHPGSAFCARAPRTGQDASTLLYCDEITNLFDNLIGTVEGR